MEGDVICVEPDGVVKGGEEEGEGFDLEMFDCDSGVCLVIRVWSHDLGEDGAFCVEGWEDDFADMRLILGCVFDEELYG